jgi:hypothetical protein
MRQLWNGVSLGVLVSAFLIWARILDSGLFWACSLSNGTVCGFFCFRRAGAEKRLLFLSSIPESSSVSRVGLQFHIFQKKISLGKVFYGRILGFRARNRLVSGWRQAD